VKAGSAVPVKFSLGGPQGLAILPGVRWSSSARATARTRKTRSRRRQRRRLSYDAGTDTYTYVWKTQKSWAGRCGTAVVALTDGTTHTFDVRFKS
jgi:hypothetical protein